MCLHVIQCISFSAQSADMRGARLKNFRIWASEQDILPEFPYDLVASRRAKKEKKIIFCHSVAHISDQSRPLTADNRSARILSRAPANIECVECVLSGDCIPGFSQRLPSRQSSAREHNESRPDSGLLS